MGEAVFFVVLAPLITRDIFMGAEPHSDSSIIFGKLSFGVSTFVTLACYSIFSQV
jgi:hypothetical protein